MTLYLLFAITTALASAYLLLNPVLDSLSIDQPLNVIIQNKFLTYIIFICISVIIAPIMFIAAILPKSNKTFQETLIKQLRD